MLTPRLLHWEICPLELCNSTRCAKFVLEEVALHENDIYYWVLVAFFSKPLAKPRMGGRESQIKEDKNEEEEEKSTLFNQFPELIGNSQGMGATARDNKQNGRKGREPSGFPLIAFPLQGSGRLGSTLPFCSTV